MKLPWNDNLTGPALRIAATNDTPLRVRAGPGTGKTFALMRRIARFLEQNVDPEQIWVGTFTRTAATDLKQELEKLHAPGADAVRATTVHALCFEILAKNDVLQITGRTPRPLLDYEKRFLLEDLKSNGLGGVHECGKRLSAFEAAWARLQHDQPGWPTDPQDQRFEQVLLAWLKFHQAMLIGELVPEALRFVRNNPASSDVSRFSHVLIDEYQDLNVAEQEFIQLLASNSVLTIIGDEDQSIYSFKHAHPEGISEFNLRHSNTADETLEYCRRCPRTVVEMANSLIIRNVRRTNRVLLPNPGNGSGEMHVLQWQSADAEANGLAKIIKKRIENQSIEPGKVLVLSPVRQFGYQVRDKLKSLGVPAHSFFAEQALDGDPNKLDESRSQQAFTLLTLLANPEDAVALRCWCGFGKAGLRSSVWTRIRSVCVAEGKPLAKVLAEIEAGQRTIPYMNDLRERLAELRSKIKKLQALSGSDLVDALFPAADPDFDQIRLVAGKVGGGASAKQVLNELRTNITQPELPTDVDYVRVMSLHKSKGLTADFVVVVGCIEGLIPRLPKNATQVEIEGALEEQRRLFYVALTRAKKTLILSSVTSLPSDRAYRMGVQVRGRGNLVRTITSRFIAELGPTCPQPILGNQLLT